MKIRIPAVLVVIALTITTASAQYKRTDLVSNGPTVAPFTDPHLVNAWGLVALPTRPWWPVGRATVMRLSLFIDRARVRPPRAWLSRPTTQAHSCMPRMVARTAELTSATAHFIW